jgi:hypothetical protein
MESGGAVGLRRVDVDVLLQKGARGCRISLLHGVDEPHIGASR